MLYYAGPDQIIPLTSILGTLFGMALVFWSKIVILYHKLADSLRGRHNPAQEPAELQEPAPKP